MEFCFLTTLPSFPWVNRRLCKKELSFACMEQLGCWEVASRHCSKKSSHSFWLSIVQITDWNSPLVKSYNKFQRSIDLRHSLINCIELIILHTQKLQRIINKCSFLKGWVVKNWRNCQYSIVSSFHSVLALWEDCEVLVQHFEEAKLDSTRDKKDTCIYEGLQQNISSTEFVLDLGLMCEALQELSELSLDL